MCLKATRSTPYNHSGIAYKLLIRINGKWASPFQYTRWHKNQLRANYSRKVSCGEVMYGIHCFPHLRDALKCYHLDIGRRSQTFALIKLRVRGFIAAGKHIHYSRRGNGTLGECWTHAKIIKVLRKKRYDTWCY